MGFAPTHSGFADRGVTTSPTRQKSMSWFCSDVRLWWSRSPDRSVGADRRVRLLHHGTVNNTGYLTTLLYQPVSITTFKL